MLKVQDLNDAIVFGDYEKSKEITQKLIDQGINIVDILNKSLLPGMDIVGQRFKVDEMYIPEVLMSARAMHDAMDIIKPMLSEADFKLKETIVLGTVKGDLHHIGKGIVGMMLEGAGYNVIDLGVDVPVNKFVEAAKKNNAKVVGLSALLTTTIPFMKDVSSALRADAATREVKVILGGAPVTQEYADSISADGYSSNAINAVELVKTLLY